MPKIIRDEFQDKEGNVIYPHSEDQIIWMGDGRSLRANLEEFDFDDAATTTAATALENMKKSTSLKSLFSNIKAFCKGAVTQVRVLDNYNDVVATTEEGFPVGAKALNDSLGGLSFYEDSTGKYVVGADSVPKKLGSAGSVTVTISGTTSTIQEGASALVQGTFKVTYSDNKITISNVSATVVAKVTPGNNSYSTSASIGFAAGSFVAN